MARRPAGAAAGENYAITREALVQPEKDTLDFIIIGAQKAGTSSLFQYLRTHPEISLPAEKEVPFFSHDAIYYTRGWTTYMSNLARFQGMSNAKPKWGTATPHYTAGGVWTADDAARETYDERTVPLRIHQRLPGVRLIAILRDPVERAISGHRELVMRGLDRRPLDEAIQDLLREETLERARKRPEMSTSYIVWGEYGRILAGYFDVFAPEQMLVVFTQQLQSSPAELLARIQSFIGVKNDVIPTNLGQRYNAGTDVRPFSWTRPSSWMTPYSPLSPQGVQLALSRSSAARAVWRKLPRERQWRLKGRYNRIARRVVARNRHHAAGEKLDPATLARLREHYARDTEQLATLLGVAPPWQTQAEQVGASRALT
jgi:hypothetical protein